VYFDRTSPISTIDYHRRNNEHPGRHQARREESHEAIGQIAHQLSGLQAAAKAMGNSTSRELAVVKKRVMSAASRAKMAKAAKKRWAKIKAQAKKVTK
jgi:hypothetical protein